MKAFSEKDATIEFISPDIAHVVLDNGNLTTQLLRELEAISKAQHGKTAKILIISVHTLENPDHFMRKLSHKSAHIAPGTVIALVCLSSAAYITAVNYIQHNNTNLNLNKIAVFSNYKTGKYWAESKLTDAEIIQSISPEKKLLGMSA